jgi:hypothetical protein
MGDKNKKNKFYTEIKNYYEEQKKFILKKIDVTKDFDYEFIESDNLNIVEIYLDGKIKIKAEYNVVGMYNIPLSIWYWGWNIAFINKTLTNKIMDVKNYANNISKKYNDFNKYDIEEIQYLLSNDNFYVSGDNINKLLEIALYLTKGIWILPVKTINPKKYSNPEQMDKIEYILITKILQLN